MFFLVWELPRIIKAKQSILWKMQCGGCPYCTNWHVVHFPRHGMVTNHLRAGQRLPQHTSLFCCYKRSCHSAHLSQVLQLAWSTTKKIYTFFPGQNLILLRKKPYEGLSSPVTLLLLLYCWISRVVHLLPDTQKSSSYAWVREAPERF